MLVMPNHVEASMCCCMGQCIVLNIIIPAADHYIVRLGAGNLSLDTYVCSRSIPAHSVWDIYGSCQYRLILCRCRVRGIVWVLDLQANNQVGYTVYNSNNLRVQYIFILL